MNNEIKVGSPAYMSILARVNHLERKQEQGMLPYGERRELERERSKLEEAEILHALSQAGGNK